MKLCFDKIEQEPVDIEHSFTFTEEGIEVNVNNFTGAVYKISEGEFYLRGELAAEAEFECDRCLKGVFQDMSDALELRILNYTPEMTSDETELEEEDMGVYIVEGDELDVDDILRQETLLLFPMKVECPGGCKEDSLEKVQNDDEKVDPRWEKLNKLKDS